MSTPSNETPQALAMALERLARGDLEVRLSTGADAPPAAEAFNRVAESLSRSSGESLLEPGLMRGLVRRGLHAYVGIVSIDRFGELRRQVGSVMAGEILQGLCARLRGCLQSLRLGRVGRTQIEFLFAAEDESSAVRAMEDTRRDLERRLKVRGEGFDLDVVIGFAPCDGAADSAIENAAIALARAQSGHARIAVFSDEERREALDRLELLRDLHKAIAHGGLYLEYQPKLDSRAGRFDSAEALVRWRHPDRGLIPPDHFVAVAEETGAILDMTRWVVRQAIADRALLADRGHPICLYVNLSARLLADTYFAHWLLSEVGGLECGALGVEITETAVIEDPERALAHLQAFADAGIPIAIDDYGSGLSSLAYLKQLPASELKIDRMFISNLTSSHRDPLLVRSTIDLAHALDMRVTAEGVDSPESLALLRTMGCDLIQGFLISRPVGVAELQRLLAEGVVIQKPEPLAMALRRAAGG